jgi:hypothetical protein
MKGEPGAIEAPEGRKQPPARFRKARKIRAPHPHKLNYPMYFNVLWLAGRAGLR